MPDRAADRSRFLSSAGLSDAVAAPLAGDASTRRYYRLDRGPNRESLVLMDAPPRSGSQVSQFFRVATWLAGAGLSVPRVHQMDDVLGFMLLEDFGDASFPDVISASPDMEAELYETAVRAIVAMQRATPLAGLPNHDPHTRAELTRPVATHYCTDPAQFEPVIAELETVLRRHADTGPVVIHRDCHADNLMWLPDRRGVARVGWLDFQDAELGHPAYDPVSLLKDARRDLSPNLDRVMIALYSAETGADIAGFEAAYAAFGAQRNLRILGIFARLCLDAGEPGYVRLMPRVWRHLLDCLAHPQLAGLRGCVLAALPPPTPEFMEGLKARCPRNPRP